MKPTTTLPPPRTRMDRVVRVIVGDADYSDTGETPMGTTDTLRT